MGKSTVADPQMERLATLVERLTMAQQTDSGRSQGMSDSAKIIIAVVSLFATAVAVVSGILGIAGVLYAVLKS